MLRKIQERCQDYVRIFLYPNIMRDLLLAIVLSLCFLLGFDTAHLPIKHSYAAAKGYQELQEQLHLHIQNRNPFISELARRELIESILLKANDIHLPPFVKIKGQKVEAVYFLTALIEIESGFNPRAISPVGARGYMQIMPRTSRWMDRMQRTRVALDHLYDTDINITRGVDYLNYLIRKFKNLRLVCLAYNAGEGNLKKGVWVENYWKNISNTYEGLRRKAPLSLALLSK